MLGFNYDSAARDLDKHLSTGVDCARMRLFFSNKAIRFLLSVSVSIWMAGGCLFGCSSAMGADVPSASPKVENQSCHAKHSHDCCATAKSKKRIVKTLNSLE